MVCKQTTVLSKLFNLFWNSTSFCDFWAHSWCFKDVGPFLCSHRSLYTVWSLSMLSAICSFFWKRTTFLLQRSYICPVQPSTSSSAPSTFLSAVPAAFYLITSSKWPAIVQWLKRFTCCVVHLRLLLNKIVWTIKLEGKNVTCVWEGRVEAKELNTKSCAFILLLQQTLIVDCENVKRQIKGKILGWK